MAAEDERIVKADLFDVKSKGSIAICHAARTELYIYDV